MKRTRKPIVTPSRVSDLDLSRVTFTFGPERTPVALAWTDAWLDLGASAVARRPPWISCAWCGDPHDGRTRCDRCGQKHGDAVPPVRWWETNRVDMIWWFEHRMTMAAVAFQVEHLVVGDHIERSYPPD